MQEYSALVTGGAQGIGRAISVALLDAGMHVLMFDSDARAGREAALASGARAHFLHGDAGDSRALRKAVGEAAKLGRGLHAVVSNTGISVPKPPTQLTLKQWNRVLAVNLTSAFLLAKYAAPKLKANHGAMLLIASSRATMSEPGWEAYGASKGGIVALTHALAISLGPEIRINCISPGWIATDSWQRSDKRRVPKLSAEDHAQHPVGRVGTPEDIGALARFLLSADAGFITGQEHVVDGGMTKKMIYV